MKILIGADLVPTETNYDLFSNGNVEKLLGSKLLAVLRKADMRIFNLETPLITKKTPIKKMGPVLGSDVKVIRGLKILNPSFLTLANNHIMDHGKIGLESTIKTLRENNISFGGVGNNLDEAKDNSFIIEEIDGKKIGIFVCCEHEFSIAADNKPGANPFDYIDSYIWIKENKNKCDFIIVLYHGGKEYYPYPSPKLQRICRCFVDNGADFVVCQHSHCIGCEETYHNKKIVYGQGNFLFDRSNREEWNHGLLLELNILNDNSYNLNYIITTKDGNCIRKANDDEFEKIITSYKKRSKEILTEDFIKNNYRNFALDNIVDVYNKVDLLPNTLVGRILNKLTNKKLLNLYFKKIYLKKMSYKFSNVIKCEAWNELLEEIVDSYNE